MSSSAGASAQASASASASSSAASSSSSVSALAASCPPLAALKGATVWVSGGSGFLGGALVQRLKSLHGVAEVKAIGRSATACSKLEALGATSVQCDLSSESDLTASMSGCSLAFHCAARADDWGAYDLFHEANVLGTQRVMQAARAAGVRRVVHVSTEAVLMNDAARPLLNVNEEFTLDKPASVAFPYSRSKAEAEKIALQANRKDMEVVVVRPRYIWGRGDTVLFPRLAALSREGKLCFMGSSEALSSTCHVQNVCEGMELAAVTPGIGGRVYFLTDAGEPRTVRKVWSDMLATHGLTAPKLTLPMWLAWGTAFALEKASAALNVLGAQRVAPMVTRQGIALVGQTVTVDASRARRELGYVGHVSVAQGLEDMRQEFSEQQAGNSKASASSNSSSNK